MRMVKTYWWLALAVVVGLLEVALGVAIPLEEQNTGALIGAEEAARIGLVNKVFPHGSVVEEAKKTAALIATTGPLAVAEAKKVIREGEGKTLPEANALEVQGFAGCFETRDQKEGMSAFLEKRAAAFQAE